MVGSRTNTSLSLSNAFSDIKEGFKAPVKSSFSKYRGKISFEFIRDLFAKQVTEIDSIRPAWRGLQVFAIDGDQYQLPASECVLKDGFRGHYTQGDKETHYPKMYVSHLYDVFTGTIKDVCISAKNNEIERAMDFIESLPKKSVVLYDRLYFSKKIIKKHTENGNCFLCRLRTGDKQLKEVRDFIKSQKFYREVEIEGCKVHLVRVKNPKTKEILFFATNMDRECFKNKEVADLYCRRWDIEVAYRDLTKTMRLEDWQSKNMNGILQELYASVWLYNTIKLQSFEEEPEEEERELKEEYHCSCFKSLLRWSVDNLRLIIQKKWHQWKEGISTILSRTREKRKRNERSYPRVTKQPLNRFPSQSLIPRRA